MPPIRRHNLRAIEQDHAKRSAYAQAASDLRQWFMRNHRQHPDVDNLAEVVRAAAVALEGAGYTMEARHHPVLEQGLNDLVKAVSRLLHPPTPGRGMPPIAARPPVRSQ